MSSGTRVTGSQTSVYTGCGPGSVGSTSQKSWSGSDSADLSHPSENPYYVSWSASISPLFRWDYYDSNGRWAFGSDGTHASCGFGNLTLPSWFLNDNDTLNLQSKILSSIKGSDFNLSVSLAEGKEAYGMIKDTTLSLFKAYRAIRRGNPGTAWRHLREGNLNNGRRFPRRTVRAAFTHDTSAAWLSLQYGWRPLLSDIYSGLQAVSALEEKSDSTFRRFRSSISRTISSNYSGALPSSSQRRENRYSVTVKMNTAYLSSFRSLSACGVLDPEVVAWEVVPYSFVVDWFLPIGTYLEDRAAIPRVLSTFVFGKKSVGLWLGISSSAAKPGYRVSGNSACLYRSGFFQRIIGTSWPTPLPSFRNPLSGPIKHAADAVALWKVRNP